MDQYYPNFGSDTYFIDRNYNFIFNNLRQRNEGFDVEIEIVENETVTSFKVHSQVLTMFSPEFFNTLLSDRWNTDKKPEVNDEPEVGDNPLRVMKMGIEHTNPAVFKEILDFMYTGRITFRPTNIQAVLTTAHYLQLTFLHTHAQAYLERMLARGKPRVNKHQIYEHFATKDGTEKLSRFGEKLYVFEKPTGEMLILVKSVLDDRWMFGDSLELFKTENPLEESDVYVHGKNYIILHQTPTRRLNSLPVTMGNLYYSGIIGKNVYICGSMPLGNQCFNLDSRKFTELPLPAGGINTFVNYVSETVVEGGYLNVFEPENNQWQEYKFPQWNCSSIRPIWKIASKLVYPPRSTKLPVDAIVFYYSGACATRFHFDIKMKSFANHY